MGKVGASDNYFEFFAGAVVEAVDLGVKDACRLQHKLDLGRADEGIQHVGMGLIEMSAYDGMLHLSLMSDQAFESIRAG